MSFRSRLKSFGPKNYSNYTGKLCMFDLDETLIDTSYLKRNRLKGNSRSIHESFKWCELYPFMRELLNFLINHDVQVAIVSNNYQSYCKNICDHFELPIPPENIFGAGEYPFTQAKPSPERLELCRNTLQVNYRNCLYIGDRVTDVKAAFQAYINAILVKWGAMRLLTADAFQHESYRITYLAHKRNAEENEYARQKKLPISKWYFHVAGTSHELLGLIKKRLQIASDDSLETITQKSQLPSVSIEVLDTEEKKSVIEQKPLFDSRFSLLHRGMGHNTLSSGYRYMNKQSFEEAKKVLSPSRTQYLKEILEAVMNLKYKQVVNWEKPFLDLLSRELNTYYPLFLVPIPSSKKAGTDSDKSINILAQELAKSSQKIEYFPEMLVRTKALSKTQKRNQEEQKKSLYFDVDSLPQTANILFIDDVMATCSSLRGAITRLFEQTKTSAKNLHVEAITFAYTKNSEYYSHVQKCFEKSGRLNEFQNWTFSGKPLPASIDLHAVRYQKS